jgi:teichuronic acid biosynthesis glycosyltransferase TuaC
MVAGTTVQLSTRPLRALVVTNMYPTAERPAFGRFVRDQVAALQTLPGLEVSVFAFQGGGLGAYARAAWEARRRFRGGRGGAGFDVVHAHFGLSAWAALAVPARVHAVTLHGTDLSHPRSRAITLAALPRMDLVGVVSTELATRVPRWAPAKAGGVQILPCGVDLSRFQPSPRASARGALGLDPGGRYVLFPADPARAEKRFELARELVEFVSAGRGQPVRLLTLGAVDPEQVPLYVNAANAVVVPSDREGFGLAALEALACEVPVLATPHGIAPEALDGVTGTLCAPFSLERWGAVLAAHVSAEDPRLASGRAAAERYSSVALAREVAQAWREALSRAARASADPVG